MINLTGSVTIGMFYLQVLVRKRRSIDSKIIFHNRPVMGLHRFVRRNGKALVMNYCCKDFESARTACLGCDDILPRRTPKGADPMALTVRRNAPNEHRTATAASRGGSVWALGFCDSRIKGSIEWPMVVEQ